MGDAGPFDFLNEVIRHAQDVRGHVVDLDVVQREQLGERVHGAAVLEIAEHRHGETVDRTLLFLDGVGVQKCLGRVFARPVTGVDDGLGCRLCGQCRRPLFRMTQHDGVRI